MNAAAETIDEIMAQPIATVDEKAKVLRVGRGQAYQLVNSHKIRSLKVGRRLLVPTTAIREFLEGSSVA